MKVIQTISLSILFALVGCNTVDVPQLTPLEIQSLQSRDFEQKKEIVFPAVLSVLQDLGYIIDSADLNTGFMTGHSPTDTTHDWLWSGNKYSTETAITAFVEQINPTMTKVRVNLVASKATASAWGQKTDQDTPIYDAEPYRVLFTKIGDAIFVREGMK
jgi:hypothetical protein